MLSHKTKRSNADLGKIAKKFSLNSEAMMNLVKEHATVKCTEMDVVLDDIDSGKLVIRGNNILPPVQEVESDPLELLEIIHSQSASRNASNNNKGKKDQKTVVTNKMNYQFLHIVGDPNHTGTFDQTKIIGPSGEIEGHMMIFMMRINKYYCTHCMGTIDGHLQEQHVQKCYFDAGTAIPQFYCPCCNARCASRDTYVAHVNSPTHSARIAFLKELMKKPSFYVDHDGVSYVTESNTFKSTEKYIIDTDHLIYRINSTIDFSRNYMLTDGQKLFKLMATLITNKEKSSDDIGTNLVQKNAIIKAFHMYRAEVNMGAVLCHPPSVPDDFICVSNCAVALKELNYDVINNSGVDETTKAIRRSKIDEFFTAKDVNGPNGTPRIVECRICSRNHPMRKYTNPAAIDKIITMTLSKLV